MGYIGIVDYGAGNLRSVINALSFLGFDYKASSDKKTLDGADKIILPGVGAFAAAMQQLEAYDLSSFLCEQAAKKPFFGICLGMQMLFEQSNEMRECKGLGIVRGNVRKIDTDYKLPHIGWNSLDIVNPSPLLKDVENGAFVYFIHSFCAVPENPENTIATSDYGENVCAIVQSGHIFGCQFHPEKSGETGIRIFKNFAEMRL